MLREVDELAPYFSSLYGKSFQIGIGVHFGEVVMGTIAPPGVDKVTAIGDTVNFASRIEGANKQLRTSLLISESTYELLGAKLVCRRHEGIAIAGKRGTHALYEVLALAPSMP